jgi:hypothetical protein
MSTRGTTAVFTAVTTQVMHVQAAAEGLTDEQHRGSLELLQSDIAPVLRREIPSRPFPPGGPS